MTRSLKTQNYLILIKEEKRNSILKRFNQIFLTLLAQKEDYLKLKKKVARTPLEKLIDNILEKIYRDIDKITYLNQIELIL